MSDPREEQLQGDPLIDEIRAVRKAISELFDNDVDKLCDDLQRREAEHADRIAHPAPAEESP